MTGNTESDLLKLNILDFYNYLLTQSEYYGVANDITEEFEKLFKIDSWKAG